MPPANAIRVTWMLLIMTANEKAEAVAGVEVAALGGRIGGRLELGRDQPARRPALDRAPRAARQRGAAQQQPRRQHEHRTLRQPPPVAAGEEGHSEARRPERA